MDTTPIDEHQDDEWFKPNINSDIVGYVEQEGMSVLYQSMNGKFMNDSNNIPIHKCLDPKNKSHRRR